MSYNELNKEEVSEFLKEAVEESDTLVDRKIKALLKYLTEEEGLDITEEDITRVYDDNHFDVNLEDRTRTYFVGDYDEAYDAEKEEILSLIDDLGLELFSEAFQNWILNNCIYEDGWFEDMYREDQENYANDIESEDDDVFENRLIAEMVDADILTEEDFDDWGEVHPTVKADVDLYDKQEEFVDYLCKDVDYIDEIRFSFGDKAFNELVQRYNLIDWDKVAEECISQDGLGHNLAHYDGYELELDDNLYAYRQD